MDEYLIYIIYACLIILLIILLIFLCTYGTTAPSSVSTDNFNNVDNLTTTPAEISRSMQIDNNIDEPASDDKFPFPIYIVNLDRKPERYSYVKDQLDKMSITNYNRISAVDGFNMGREELNNFGLTYELTERKGIAGCASSHIQIWNLIANNKMGWTLILEDDVNFHPNFVKLFNKYWKKVPREAKIVFPGFCADSSVEQTQDAVIQKGVMCTHAYIISWQGAQYLLDNLLPMSEPIDISIVEHFRERGGSFIFNGNIIVDGIRPNDYKESNGRRCMFNGIIYQNHEEQGSTIHGPETVF